MAHDMMVCPICQCPVFYDTEWDIDKGCCIYCKKRKKEKNFKQK